MIKHHSYRRLRALIIGLATLNERPNRAKRPKHPTNKAFYKSSSYSKSSKVADTMIETRLRL